MANPDLNWSKLGFGYRETPARFVAEWVDGAWTPGELTDRSTIEIAEGAVCLHYGQQCFEGLKATRAADGRILLFRADRNAARMARSAERLLMPPVPPEMFLRAVTETVAANRDWVPPADAAGAALYVRPVLLGVGHNLGLRPAPRYHFRVFCSPVGPYFGDGFGGGIKLRVADHDRAAPRGVGQYKVGGNYAPGLLLHHQAKADGFDEVLYLDALERRYLDEAGSANVFGVAAREGQETLVTPRSESILPSITLDSLLTLATEDLGIAVERRPVLLEEVRTFREFSLTGTATVITPVASVTHQDATWTFPESPGTAARRLFDRLSAIQRGVVEDTRGWTVAV